MRKLLNFLYRVAREVERDDCLGMSAEIAFTLMLALIQTLILAVAILGILGAKPEAFNAIVYYLGSFLPFEIYNVIRNQIVEIAQTEKSGILTFSALGTTWTMATLMSAIKKSLERAYNIKETRPYWMVKLITVLLGIIATLLVAFTLNLMFFGLQIAKFLENELGHASQLALLLRVFRLPAAFVTITFLALLMYRAIPNVNQIWSEVLPGSVLFTGCWFTFSYGFAYYIRNFPLYNTTYGALGAFLIMMMWMYLTALSLLMGGEVNAEIHRLRTLISPRSIPVLQPGIPEPASPESHPETLSLQTSEGSTKSPPPGEPHSQ